MACSETTLFLNALDVLEQLCICVCNISVAVLKSGPQSIQEPSLHYLHN